jgi:hypothetical protein
MSAYPQYPSGLTSPSPPSYPPATKSRHYQPAWSQALRAATSVHGALASRGFCCPSHLRYYTPIRQSRRLPLISQVHWLYRRSLPYDLIWAAVKTFPSLGQQSFSTCRLPYAEGRIRVHVSKSSPNPYRPSPRHERVGSPTSPTPASVGT